MKPRISIIVAMSDNRVIGNKGEIPWNIPGEQKRVKEITTPHPLIMGRKTHEAIGRVLPGRLNIIVTSDQKYEVEGLPADRQGAVVAHSLDQALDLAKKAEQERTTRHSRESENQILDQVEDDGELEQASVIANDLPAHSSLSDAHASESKTGEAGVKQSQSGQIATITQDDLAMTGREPEIFVFGGGTLYEQALPLVDRLYVTIVHKQVEGDAYFPDYSEFRKVIEREEKEFEDLKYTYLTLER